jgi:hypothetical protein
VSISYNWSIQFEGERNCLGRKEIKQQVGKVERERNVENIKNVCNKGTKMGEY